MSAGFQAEQMLGRRLRPWWGHSPWRLAMRSIVQGALVAILLYYAWGARVKDFDALGATGAQAGTVLRWLRIVLVVLLLVCIAKLVLAVLDLLSTHAVPGFVLAVERRETGDFVPPAFRRLLRRQAGRDNRTTGAQRQLRIRYRNQLVLQTREGVQTWTVRQQLVSRLRVGQEVRLSVTRLLGFVRRVDS